VTRRVRLPGRRGPVPSSLASLEDELGRAIAGYRAAGGVEDNAASSERFRELARRARRAGEEQFARRAQLLAAEAAFFAGQAAASAEPWERRALAELVGSAVGLGPEEAAPEGFAEVAASVSHELMRRVRIGPEESEVADELNRLAAVVDAHVPLDAELTGDRTRRASTTRALAALSNRHGDPSVARERLLAGLRRVDQDDVEGWLTLARAYYDGQRAQAVRGTPAHAELLAVRNTLRQRAGELRSHYRSRAGRLWASQELAEILSQLLHDDFEDGVVYEAAQIFSALESLKARTLLDALTCPYAPLPPTETKAALALERKLTRFAPPDVQTRLEREVALASGLPIGTGWDVLERKRQLDTIEHLYASHGGGFAASASPARLEEIQAALEPDEALIQYVVFPYGRAPVPATDLWAMVITRERTQLTAPLRFTAPPDNPGGIMSVDGRMPLQNSPLTNAVATLRTDIQNGDDDGAVANLSELYQLLIEPVIQLGFEPGDFARWIIVPDGPLHFVPFGALARPGGRRLISEVALSVTPSASVFRHLRQGDRSKAASYLALIDPDLGRLGRPRLRQAAAEIASLERALSPLAGGVFTGLAANEPTLRQLAPGRSIVHVTTHGEFPEENAIDLHRVLLAESEGDDGRLHAEEIRQLDLRAALLFTLHVCDAGLFRVGPGDELYGLVPALITAGASNVLATLWPVEHEVSRYFTAAFYDAVLDAGPAEAARLAATALMDDGAPLRHWCSFALSGSARPFRTGSDA
jgi:CHAT domain-containing protein